MEVLTGRKSSISMRIPVVPTYQWIITILAYSMPACGIIVDCHGRCAVADQVLGCTSLLMEANPGNNSKKDSLQGSAKLP